MIIANCTRGDVEPPGMFRGMISIDKEVWMHTYGHTERRPSVDVVKTLAQVGMVPIFLEEDVRSRRMRVTYRWEAFRPLSDDEVAPEYTVTIHVSPTQGNGHEITALQINAVGVSWSVWCVLLEERWVINPTPAEHLQWQTANEDDTLPRVPEATQARLVEPRRRLRLRVRRDA